MVTAIQSLRGLAAFLVVIASMIFAVPEAGSITGKRHCGVAGASVLRSGERATVLKDRKGNIHGCWRRTQRRTTLLRVLPKQSFDSYEATYLTLQGRFVGIELRSSGRSGENYTLRIIDLRRGRIQHSIIPFRQEVFADSRGQRRAIQQLLIARDGDAAWITRNIALPEERLQVYKVDSKRQLLDAGPGVERRSLAVTGSGVIYWTNSGQARRARLD